jgi:hypothetical protein
MAAFDRTAQFTTLLNGKNRRMGHGLMGDPEAVQAGKKFGGRGRHRGFLRFRPVVAKR